MRGGVMSGRIRSSIGFGAHHPGAAAPGAPFFTTI
jgi:hypothetical protein